MCRRDQASPDVQSKLSNFLTGTTTLPPALLLGRSLLFSGSLGGDLKAVHSLEGTALSK